MRMSSEFSDLRLRKEIPRKSDYTEADTSVRRGTGSESTVEKCEVESL